MGTQGASSAWPAALSAGPTDASQASVRLFGAPPPPNSGERSDKKQNPGRKKKKTPPAGTEKVVDMSREPKRNGRQKRMRKKTRADPARGPRNGLRFVGDVRQGWLPALRVLRRRCWDRCGAGGQRRRVGRGLRQVLNANVGRSVARGGGSRPPKLPPALGLSGAKDRSLGTSSAGIRSKVRAAQRRHLGPGLSTCRRVRRSIRKFFALAASPWPARTRLCRCAAWPMRAATRRWQRSVCVMKR